jgi:selenocysteine lyase/cysteine desulfurase
MPFDVARVRAETPGCAHVLHFNNAGAGLMPQPVLDAQVAYLAREAEVGAYEVGAEMHDALMDTYGAVAEMLGARPAEIALLENATRAWQAVFYGMTFKAGDRILDELDHGP